MSERARLVCFGLAVGLTASWAAPACRNFDDSLAAPQSGGGGGQSADANTAGWRPAPLGGGGAGFQKVSDPIPIKAETGGSAGVEATPAEGGTTGEDSGGEAGAAHDNRGEPGAAGNNRGGEAGAVGSSGGGNEPAPIAEWTPASGTFVPAQQAVSSNGVIYILGGTRVQGGYHLKRATDGAAVSERGWEDVGGVVGTSLALSARAELWIVGEDSSVWEQVWERSTASWFYLASETCEDETHVTINQNVADNPHNTLAVGRDADFNDEVYVLSDGTVRWFTGSCWGKLADLPWGTAEEVAIDNRHFGSQMPWVINRQEDIFRWDGSEWIALTTGSAKSLNSNAQIIGIDSTSIWNYNGYDFRLGDWNHGGIRHLGTTSVGGAAQVQQVLVDTDGVVWLHL